MWDKVKMNSVLESQFHGDPREPRQAPLCGKEE